MKEEEKAFWNTFLNQKVGNITEEYDFFLDEPFGSLYQSVLAAFLAWVRPDWSLFSLLQCRIPYSEILCYTKKEIIMGV